MVTRQKRHRWNNGDTCLDCGLHREGAGSGPYGSMRYYRDGQAGPRDYKPGPCFDLNRILAGVPEKRP